MILDAPLLITRRTENNCVAVTHGHSAIGLARQKPSGNG